EPFAETRPIVYPQALRIEESLGYSEVADEAIDYQSGPQRYCWQTRKMSDKLQFVGAFGRRRGVGASDKLKFVGHFHYPFALLPSLPAVSRAPALQRLSPFQLAVYKICVRFILRLQPSAHIVFAGVPSETPSLRPLPSPAPLRREGALSV